jgi:tryptophan halogenase
MDVPDSLKHKKELFKHRGFVDTYKFGLFSLPSWVSVYIGQHFIQESIDPFSEKKDKNEITNYLQDMDNEISKRFSRVSKHDDFIRQYCASKIV